MGKAKGLIKYKLEACLVSCVGGVSCVPGLGPRSHSPIACIPVHNPNNTAVPATSRLASPLAHPLPKPVCSVRWQEQWQSCVHPHKPPAHRMQTHRHATAMETFVSSAWSFHDAAHMCPALLSLG